MESDFTIRNEVDSVRPPHAEMPYMGPENDGYSQVNFRLPPNPVPNPFLSPIDARSYGNHQALEHYYLLVREYQTNNFKLAMAILATIKWVAISAAIVACALILKNKAKI